MRNFFSEGISFWVEICIEILSGGQVKRNDRQSTRNPYSSYHVNLSKLIEEMRLGNDSSDAAERGGKLE